MTPENIAQEVRNYILENFLFGEDGDSLADDASFLESGILDSTGVLELVAFIEETYGIKVEDEEIIPENLDSIENLVRYVRGKMAEGIEVVRGKARERKS